MKPVVVMIVAGHWRGKWGRVKTVVETMMLMTREIRLGNERVAETRTRTRAWMMKVVVR